MELKRIMTGSLPYFDSPKVGRRQLIVEEKEKKIEFDV